MKDYIITYYTLEQTVGGKGSKDWETIEAKDTFNEIEESLKFCRDVHRGNHIRFRIKLVSKRVIKVYKPYKKR